MERRIYNVAQTNDVRALKELLNEDPHILEKISLGTDDPLHIAALLGHVEFVKEFIIRKPGFVTELNKDGFSPLHLASANGHIEIVKVLLIQFGYSLCVLKDIQGQTALHCAVTKGRIDVICEMLSASLHLIREVTARCENVFHLAVKHNQFDALKVLVERNTDGGLLNAKDRDGNTVLHLAVARRQHRTVELLLAKEMVSKLDVNAKNRMNLTPMDILDILLQISCDYSDLETIGVLQRAGALRSRDVNADCQVTQVLPLTQTVTEDLDPPTNFVHVQADQTSSPAVKGPLSVRVKKLLSRVIKFGKDFYTELYREIAEAPSETRNSLMVVAVLIATVTYQGGLHPPGGVWQDHQRKVHTTVHSQISEKYWERDHDAGKAIMVYEHLCYVLFMVFNSVGFVMSLFIISLLTINFPLKAWLQLAVVSMGTAFGCGFCFIASFQNCVKVFLLLFFCGAIAYWLYWWVEKWAVVVQRHRKENSENQRPSIVQRFCKFITFNSASVAPNSTV